MDITRTGKTDRMSRIVKYGNTVYLCGQVAKSYDDDIQGQTKTTLEKIEELLNEAGTKKENILSVTVYIKDMNMFSSMNEIWDGWVDKENPPARTCVEAKMANEKILIEMTVIAGI